MFPRERGVLASASSPTSKANVPVDDAEEAYVPVDGVEEAYVPVDGVEGG